MSNGRYMSHEERAAARAIMAHADAEARARDVEARLGCDRPYAEALLAHVVAASEARKASTRVFVDVLSSGAEDIAKPLIVLQLCVAAGAIALAVFVTRAGYWFFGLVLVGVAATNVVAAYRARQRSLRRAAPPPAVEPGAPEPRS